MNIPVEFDDIRPYFPEEMPAAFDRLLSDESFCQIALSFFKDKTVDDLRHLAATCTDNVDFQKKFLYALMMDLLSKTSVGYGMNITALSDIQRGYTFVSNHRDIVLDAAFLDIFLIEKGFPTTVEIAIGDNLLITPWIETLVRLNKSFIVKRSVGVREMLESSRLMSRYMHFAIRQKHENIWIAQREGRAKDSDDRTQESVLKMMAMGGEGTPIESLKELNIVPLTISYEYDPCDYLKAQEFQLKRDVPEFKKTQADDLKNMQTGIFGYKGQIHYEAAPCINVWIDELKDLPKNRFFGELARRMDIEIHSRYHLYSNNYIAADMLDATSRFSDKYTPEEHNNFEEYLNQRLALIQLPGKDEAFLRERILVMYANPLRNYINATV